MKKIMKTYRDFYFDTVKKVLAVDSVTGYCFKAIDLIESYANEYGYKFERTVKGNGVIHIPGADTNKTIALSAHVDTIGMMVRSINSDGTLNFSKVGGITLPTMDGEYCRVTTRDGKVYSGTVLCKHAAAHVHMEAHSAVRDEHSMYIRLDEVVKSKDDVLDLGIRNGDFISPDTKTVVTESGFLKSRFIDDKASVAMLITIMKYLKEQGLKPAFNTQLLFTTYEEIGHGASYISPEISEILALDMGCIGEDLSCTEYDVSICAKDASGPYDFNMISTLIELSEKNDLSYAVDLYPKYASDISAALRGGNNIRGALIGTGVHASHGMERTHWKGILNTMCLAAFYLDPK